MNILFVAAEASPLVKVGGLADVVGSLPKALNKLGHEVRILLPRYGAIDMATYILSSVAANFNVRIFGTIKTATLSLAEIKGELRVYLVENDEFFGSDEVYGGNDLNRFLFFDNAVVEGLPRLDWQPDIVHCHDWHTGLIPMRLKKVGWGGALIFTIHNLAYQGFFDNHFMAVSGLNQDWQHRPGGMPELPFSFMSQGIAWADLLTTVSENYASEIVTPQHGAGLDNLLRRRQDKLVGIVNGIDYEEYNPNTDHFIAANYDSERLDSRLMNKLGLQRKVGLPVDINIPLIGMVSRLDEQKGLDIVMDALPLIFEQTNIQMVILGTGRHRYHHLLRKATKKYQCRLAVSHDFDDALAHLIYAGCDIFLVPSRFEPCGITQMEAMRYGAIPVVRKTGGLADTVEDFDPGKNGGTGFVFEKFSSHALFGAIVRALETYKYQNVWQKLVKKAMSVNFSWEASAQKYLDLYKKTISL